MTELLAVVVGVASVCFLMMWFMQQLPEEKHFLFKLLLIFFIMACMMLIPKTLIDNKTVCETIVANSTQLSANAVQYNYDRFCFERDENTAESFYRTTTWLYRLFIGYTIVFLFVWALMKLGDSAGKGRKSQRGGRS